MTAAEQKRFYARHGYLIVPRLLTPRELARLRAALVEVLGRARRLTSSTRTFRLVPGLDGRRHVKRVWDPIAQHAAFYRLAVDRRILDVVQRLIGRDIQLHQSRMNLKPRTPHAWFDWHQDYPAFPHTNFDLLIVTVYLDDSTAANGCLTVIPGSHRLGPLPHRFTFEGASRTELVNRRVVADRARWRELAVPAGGITVHHGNMLHSSRANLTDRPRSTLQLWYRAADNVQLGGSTDFAGWGLQVRGVDPGVARMAASTCRLPGGAPLPPRERRAVARATSRSPAGGRRADPIENERRPAFMKIKSKRKVAKSSKAGRGRTLRDLPARRGAEQTIRGGGRGGSASKIQN